MLFDDVLKIKNGKNQRVVEDPDGQYPIYGSGGVMGRANDYICEADTVIIGRKGNINKPIYVEEPFWNVDTAFGLEANRTVLLPRYLYYFCLWFDFERLNKAVTIPSLTKADLLKIEMDLPEMDKQADVVNRLEQIEEIIAHRKRQLQALDELIKARFVELFESENDVYEEIQLEEIADIVSGITKGRKTKSTNLRKVPYMAVSNVKDGYIDWTTVKTILATEDEIEQYRLVPDDVLMTEGGDPDKVGRGSIITEPPIDCIHQNHIFRVRLDENQILPRFFSAFLQSPKAKTYFLRAAKQTTGIASINMKQLRGLPTIVPPMDKQLEYVRISEQIDKSKLLLSRVAFFHS